MPRIHWKCPFSNSSAGFCITIKKVSHFGNSGSFWTATTYSQTTIRFPYWRMDRPFDSRNPLALSILPYFHWPCRYRRKYRLQEKFDARSIGMPFDLPICPSPSTCRYIVRFTGWYTSRYSLSYVTRCISDVLCELGDGCESGFHPLDCAERERCFDFFCLLSRIQSVMPSIVLVTPNFLIGRPNVSLNYLIGRPM